MTFVTNNYVISFSKELTYDYNFHSVFSKNMQKCFCNSVNCHNIIELKISKRIHNNNKLIIQERQQQLSTDLYDDKQ